MLKAFWDPQKWSKISTYSVLERSFGRLDDIAPGMNHKHLLERMSSHKLATKESMCFAVSNSEFCLRPRFREVLEILDHFRIPRQLLFNLGKSIMFHRGIKNCLTNCPVL